MFMRIAAIPGMAANIVALHPAEVAVLLEQGWNNRSAVGPVGTPQNRSHMPGLALALPAMVDQLGGIANNQRPVAQNIGRVLGPPTALPEHLIYAFMIENTAIYEIMRRVLHEFAHGEKLGAAASPGTQQWLITTEEIFYRNPPPLTSYSIVSDIRPDLRATRRNAYQRLFGMTLLHGREDGSSYPFHSSNIVNSPFANTLSDLLREVNIGREHLGAAVANPTDNGLIADLSNRLYNMLSSRRAHGTLAREEFFSVAAMSWLHVAVSFNSPVVNDLRAGALEADQRLLNIAQAVNMPSHGLSRSYFELAQPLARLLSFIEGTGPITAAVAPVFYNPAVGFGLPGLMENIGLHWGNIIGRDLKARRVAPVAA